MNSIQIEAHVKIASVNTQIHKLSWCCHVNGQYAYTNKASSQHQRQIEEYIEQKQSTCRKKVELSDTQCRLIEFILGNFRFNRCINRLLSCCAHSKRKHKSTEFRAKHLRAAVWWFAICLLLWGVSETSRREFTVKFIQRSCFHAKELNEIVCFGVE